MLAPDTSSALGTLAIAIARPFLADFSVPPAPPPQLSPPLPQPPTDPKCDRQGAVDTTCTRPPYASVTSNARPLPDGRGSEGPNVLFVHAYLRQIREAGWLARWNGPQTKLIMAYLSFADRHGVAYPGLTLLAQATGMSTRNVERTRQTLARAGYLMCVTRSNGRIPSQWRLALPIPAATPAPVAGVEAANPGATGYPTPAQAGTQHRCRRVSNPGALRRPNSIEQTKEQTINSAGPAGGGGVGGFFKGGETPGNDAAQRNPAGAPVPVPPPRTAVTGGAPTGYLLAYLTGLNINPTKAVRTGLREYAWTLDELKAKWRHTVNTWPMGKRCGPLAQAIAEGDKFVPRQGERGGGTG